ncbi:MAG: 4Fe-4S dicluster domain-containing protein [Phycisphaerae bacterium]|nr:4Fe-4S dicluster domain-containing protein [Phycisphaerae bacterium]
MWPSADVLRLPRGPASAKPFCFPPKEVVGHYADHPASAATATAAPATTIVGVRACELQAIAYLDRVFGQPPVSDPFYREHRAAQTIISVDCVEPHETCFCTLVDGRPYATEGFDLNLTPIDGGFVVEAGTDAGRLLVEQAGDAVTPASPEMLAERDRLRRAAVEKLSVTNEPYQPARPPSEALAAAEDAAVWDRFAQDCVECGACTQICPTCHCFYLFDRGAREDGAFDRLRAWDSCMWSGYSRMAGAPTMKPNPRAQFRSRFANRFLHKYLWSPQQWDKLGCVGCGRCTEACAGRIDIRRVIREVSA